MKLEYTLFDGARTLRVLDDSDAVTKPQLVLYFGARALLEDRAHFAALRARYPDAHLVGCSTSGEILQRSVHDDTIVAVAVEFEHSRLRVASLVADDELLPAEAGAELARALRADDMRALMLISDGIHINGSELVRGATGVLGAGFPITGGLAGDADRFERTLVGCDSPPEPRRIAAIGFYGAGLEIGHGSIGGWDTFGPERVITRSAANVLYELDGTPALDLYRRYLGDEAANLPGSALLFPLMVRPDSNSDGGVVRTVLAVDEDQRTMTFAGDIPQGYKAQLMRANFDRLIEGAGEAARIAGQGLDGARKLAVLISCVGRKMVLGQRTRDEVSAVARLLGSGVSQIGYYSYGEISPHFGLGTCELHNQTMTVTVIGEKAA